MPLFQISNTLDEIPRLAKTIARKLRGGEVIALMGDLGSGKTTFTKALGKELGIKKNIGSPTYVIMQVFQGKLPTSPKKPIYLYHLDIYRTESFQEIKTLGITEIWQQPDSITVIEWADKIKRHLPRNTTYIHFKPV